MRAYRYPYIAFALTLVSCQRQTPDKSNNEAVELTVKLAKSDTKPSFAAVAKPEPSLNPGALSAKRELTQAEINRGARTHLFLHASEVQNSAQLLGRLALETYEPENKLTYLEISKNPNKYIGKPWRTVGLILQISEEKYTFGRMKVAGGELFFFEPGHTEFLQGDVVEAIGYISGYFEYKSAAGWNIVVPSMIVAGFMPPGQFGKILRRAQTKAKSPKR